MDSVSAYLNAYLLNFLTRKYLYNMPVQIKQELLYVRSMCVCRKELKPCKPYANHDLCFGLYIESLHFLLWWEKPGNREQKKR